ncbi:pyridoxal phosphate-dependent aminotransferase [Chloroflexota bacterium]
MADQNKAINLGQGFTDQAAIFEMVWGGISASLGGTEDGMSKLENITIKEISQKLELGTEKFMDLKLKDVLQGIQGKTDVLNQYSYPFGLPDLRNAIADYTERFLNFRPDPDSEITVVVGATEGLFTSLRAICNPGDEIVIIQPYHEMYLLQSITLGLKPKYITLRENNKEKTWDLDRNELEEVINDNTRALVFNTPHNPTGKVFTMEEMEFIAGVCKKHNVIVVTDEIYEHILFTGKKHYSMANLDGMRDNTFVINAISKTGNATGWRIGWVISPPKYTPIIRGIHDTIVLQAPTPLQKGAERLLRKNNGFYGDIRKGYIEKLNVLTEALQKAGFVLTPPEGAYYLFANYSSVPALNSLSPMDAAMFLIEKNGVAAVPGDNFYAVGDYGSRYLRFAFCRSLETLQEGARRLGEIA